MNAPTSQPDTRFERLADGELSPAEYRELLSSLDDQPDGWRRCALALLEAQALGSDLSAIRQAPAPPAPLAEAPVTTVDRPGDWSQRTWQGLYFATIAASLALAFYMGSWTNGWNDPSGAGSIATNVERSRSNQRDEPKASPRTSTAPQTALVQEDAPLGNLQLVVDGERNPQRVTVPVYGQDQIEHWNTVNKPVLSPQVIEQLEQAGHKIDHRQQWLRIDTDDGRQVLVPVDDYRIQPPSRPAY